MKIGIIGSGDVAKALAKGFLGNGHQVMFGTRTSANIRALRQVGLQMRPLLANWWFWRSKEPPPWRPYAVRASHNWPVKR